MPDTGRPTFILASASPRRLQLLQQVGLVPDQIIPANIDETPRKGELPDDYAMRVAEHKAAVVSVQYRDAVVLAADTVVAAGRRILPKAEEEKTAKRCLELLSGRRHRVYTAVCIISPLPLAGGAGEGKASVCPPAHESALSPLYHPASGGNIRSTLAMTQVRFARLSEKDIAHYLASREWHGKAGGYAIQGLAEAFIPWIGGSYSNVVGLPLAQTCKLLAAAGIDRLREK